jgi:hypothetical protein
MTTANHADVYFTAEFIDGPLANTSERRVLVRGTHDAHLNTVALVDGMESIFRYVAVGTKEVAGTLRVQYSFDAPDSDTFVSEDENE